MIGADKFSRILALPYDVPLQQPYDTLSANSRRAIWVALGLKVVSNYDLPFTEQETRAIDHLSTCMGDLPGLGSGGRALFSMGLTGIRDHVVAAMRNDDTGECAPLAFQRAMNLLATAMLDEHDDAGGFDWEDQVWDIGRLTFDALGLSARDLADWIATAANIALGKVN